MMAPGGAAHADVVRSFGGEVLAPDGSLDRKRLGALVFADAEARARLNALVHPRVREEEARRAAAAGPEAVVVTDAALLVEAGVHLRFRRLVVVHCPPDLQRQRLRERDGLDDAAADARLSAQMPIAEKRAFAHLEVDTSGSFADTDQQVQALIDRLRALAPGLPRPAPVPLERAAGCLLLGPAEGPRGLRPADVLGEIADRREPEMERLAGLLLPPAEHPWYRAARPGNAVGPEALAGPVALWSLARAGEDDEHVVAAAASLARLTHSEAAARAGAGLQALLLHTVAAGGSLGPGLRDRMAAHAGRATRWGGAPPGPRVRASLEAALRHPGDAAEARRAAADAETGDLAAALVGVATGVSLSAAPPRLVAALRELNAHAAD